MVALKAGIRAFRQNWSWLKWLVAALLLGYLFYHYRSLLFELWERKPNWPDLAIAVVIAVVSILLTFYRWYLLVWAQDFPFTLRDALRLGFIGYACNFLSLGTAGGDFVKGGMIAAEQTSRKLVAASTVLLDRILGLLALFIVGSLAFFLQPAALREDSTIRIYAVILWAGTLGGIVGLAILLHPAVPRSWLMLRLVRTRWIGQHIGSLVNAVLLYQARGRVLVFAVLISIVGHFGMLSGFYFCARAVQAGAATPGYWAHLLLVPGAEVGAVFVPVPAGLGALEGLMAKGYQVANEAAGSPVSAEAAGAAGVATTLAYRASTIVIAAIGALYYFFSRREIVRALKERDDSGPAAEPAQ